MDFEPSQGAIPSPRDYRDIPLAAVGSEENTVYALGLPDSYFVELKDIPVWHQRKIGACVGHAAAKYKQVLDLKDTGEVIPYSARFLYAIAKARDGYTGEGTFPRLVAKILKDIGCATEDECPNDTTLTHEEYVYDRIEKDVPGADSAAPAQIGGYAFPNVKDAVSLKKAITEFGGSMLLMMIGDEWWKRKDGVTSWSEADIIPLRPPAQTVSGHEVYLYGYEDVVENGVARTKFYILNSWSLDWGIKGKAWFYFDEYRNHMTEAITFVDLPNDLKKRVSELPDAKTFKHTFSKDIVAGERSDEVKALQTALMIDGQFDKELYTELLKEGSLGFFRPNGVTQKALLAYQLKYLPPSGVSTVQDLVRLNGARCGPKTRAQLNKQFA